MAVDPAVVAVTFIGCLLGGFVKGVSGSGLPQIAVPLIALLTDVPTAIAVVQLPAMSINLFQARPQNHSAGELIRHWPVFLTLFFATIIGVSILKVATPALLFALTGGLTIAAAVFLAVTPEFCLPGRWRLGLGLPVAMVAGLAAGLSSLAGPILIPYLLALKLPKDLFVSTISICYLCVIVPTIASLLYWDIVIIDVFLFSILAIGPAILGMITGNRVRSYINDRQFRNIVIFMLILAAIGLVGKAVEV
jgi:hypothetical protein